MGCAESHAAAVAPQACADKRMINFCPWCGKTVADADAKFCTRCGGMFPVAEPRPGDAPRYDVLYGAREHEPGREGKRLKAAAAVFIVLFAGLFGVMFVGGTSDLEIGYEGEEFVFTNASKGLFSGYTWTILDQSGNTVVSKNTESKSSVKWTPPDIKAENDTDRRYSMKLTAHSMLGYERTSFKMFGLRSYDVEWSTANGDHTVTVSMHLGEYQQYLDYDFANSKYARWPGTDADGSLINIFMHTETSNNAFAKVVHQLKEQIAAADMSEEEAVNHIAGFVQNLDGANTYKYDTVINGQEEYWSFPLETLFHKGGDCEDLAMLLMALVRECFDGKVSTALALFMEPDTDGHAMAAVCLAEEPAFFPQPSGSSMVIQNTCEYTFGGMTYYTCETTLAGCTVGMISGEYNGGPTMLLVAAS